MKYVFLLLTLALLIPVVFADESSCAVESEQVCELLEEMQVEVGQEVPGLLVPKNSVIDLMFTNQTRIGHVVVEGGVVSAVECCISHPAPTHTATVVSVGVVEEIRSSEQPLSETQTRLSSGEIELDAVRIDHRVRLAATKVFIRLGSWFGR